MIEDKIFAVMYVASIVASGIYTTGMYIPTMQKKESKYFFLC